MTRVVAAVFTLIVLVWDCSAPVVAGPFEDGVVAYGKGDFVSSLRLWRPLADQGNAAAQSNLGLVYGKGQGVQRDYVRAYMWSSLSAAQGHQDGAKNKEIVARGMTPAQMTEAQNLVRAWKPTPQSTR